MEGKFTDFVVSQLKAMIDDLDGARPVTNDDLSKVVMRELRAQYDRLQSGLPKGFYYCGH